MLAAAAVEEYRLTFVVFTARWLCLATWRPLVSCFRHRN